MYRMSLPAIEAGRSGIGPPYLAGSCCAQTSRTTTMRAAPLHYGGAEQQFSAQNGLGLSDTHYSENRVSSHHVITSLAGEEGLQTRMSKIFILIIMLECRSDIDTPLLINCVGGDAAGI